jgi:hypothetical protein
MVRHERFLRRNCELDRKWDGPNLLEGKEPLLPDFSKVLRK